MLLSTSKKSNLLVLLLALNACAPAAPVSIASKSDATEIINANAVDVKKEAIAAQIVQLMTMTLASDGQNMEIAKCTGTLIGERLVVTAAHCLSDAIGKKLKVVKDDDMKKMKPTDSISKLLPAIMVFSPTGAKGNVVDYAYVSTYIPSAPSTEKTGDVALLKLDQPMRSEKGNSLKAPGFRFDTKGLVSVGSKVSLYGYGVSDISIDDKGEEQHKSEGLRKKAFQVINPSDVDNDINIPDGFFVSAADGLPEGAACQGDSGGPTLMRSGTDIVLVGVTSRVYGKACSGGNIVTSVAAHAAWIAKQAAKWGLKLF